MNIFAAIAEPARKDILDALAVRPRAVNELVALFDLSQPGISRHLKVLREAGLVTVAPRGQTRVYHLDARPLQELDAWLGRYRKFWAEKLDALETFMDEEPE